MKLLLSVHLPLLPLETLRPSWSEAGIYAVMDQQKVYALSPEAARSGVRTGMRAAGVAAIAPDTILIDRNVEKESHALESIAMALLRFTPEVTFADDFSILMDVSASLRLFNGPHALCRRVSRSVALLGFTVQMGSAPTAQGAWLLARDSRRKGMICRRRALAMATLHRYLDILPNDLLPSAAAQNLLGVHDKVEQARRRLSERENNALSVRVELQADCYAGLWAKQTNNRENFLEPGDIESAMEAAAAVGDAVAIIRVTGCARDSVIVAAGVVDAVLTIRVAGYARDGVVAAAAGVVDA